MDVIIPIMMIVMGVAIAGVWTRDIASSDDVDRSKGLVHARDSGDRSLLVPHWLAEYGTAGALVLGASGLMGDAGWGPSVAAIGTGALLYTSTNSLGWALAKRERFTYAVPMAAGIVVGLASTAYLVAP
jgi:hypothetical protein